MSPDAARYIGGGLEQETEYHGDEIIRYIKALEARPIVDQYDTFPGWMKML
jgi:hypothetical protein